MITSRKSLSEADWARVFRIRCAVKQGQHISDGERALFVRASDPERYAAMDADVFDATVPLGSTARARRK